MLETILVPVDGSAHADAAVDFASGIAAKFGSRLVIVNVIAKPGADRVPEELKAFAELERVRMTERDLRQSAADEIVNDAEKRARRLGVGKVETVTATGDPALAIVELARKRNADLVAMGRRGLGDIKGLLFGSVSHKVSHLAGCPCLTVM